MDGGFFVIMRKYILEVSLVIGLAVSILIGSFASARQDDLSDKLIRLHIIANSDSQEDQALKYKVRDRILLEVSRLTEDAADIDESRLIIRENLESLSAIAADEIKACGFDYEVSATLEDVYFPTREYESFSLPAGNYEALRIIIGSGKGKNWWCVLFPPLCISASEAEVELSARNAGLSQEEISLITSDETSYKFKFKLIEVVESLIHKARL